MEITLPNGLVLSGTMDQITEAARKLGYSASITSGMYNSGSKGWVRIVGMETTHIRNAMLKIYRGWAESLSALTDAKLLHELRSGPVSNQTFVDLLTEYAKRVK